MVVGLEYFMRGFLVFSFLVFTWEKNVFAFAPCPIHAAKFLFFRFPWQDLQSQINFSRYGPPFHTKFLVERKMYASNKKDVIHFHLLNLSRNDVVFCLSNDALCMINAPLWWRIGKPWIHWEKQIWFFLFLVTVAAIWLRNGPITQPVVEQLGIIASGILVFPIPSPWLFSLFSILDQSLMVWWITS